MKRRIDDLGRISIPAEMKKEIGLNNGSEAKIEIEDHKIIITKPDSIDYKTRNEKAIEYIEDRYDYEQRTLIHTFDKCNVGELYEILKGRKD